MLKPPTPLISPAPSIEDGYADVGYPIAERWFGWRDIGSKPWEEEQ
jgi:hypothetical protein